MANDSVVATFAKLVEYIANKFLRGDITLADLVKLDDQEIEVIFLLGHYLYNFGKYQNSLNIFSVLTLYKPFVSRYWRAAGAANQAMKKYQEAIVAYDMAITTNLNDAISYVYRGESKISMGDLPAGVDDLRQAIAVGSQHPFYAQWVGRARPLLEVRGVEA